MHVNAFSGKVGKDFGKVSRFSRSRKVLISLALSRVIFNFGKDFAIFISSLYIRWSVGNKILNRFGVFGLKFPESRFKIRFFLIMKIYKVREQPAKRRMHKRYPQKITAGKLRESYGKVRERLS